MPERSVHEKAEGFADAWTPIFQRSPPTESGIRELLSSLDPPDHAEDLDTLIKPITEDEVAAAIKACKPGKACGPDGLGNDWYHDYADALVPILCKLYNLWYTSSVFPASFLEADIFCLKKTGDLSNPLNYRPLALLNSDYKIFTRILATRTSDKLAGIIHPHQAGFVPGRQLHDTVDLLSAARVTAETDPDQAAALALLLDYEKAYDSLARLFLFIVLE
ncbi:hypothetical protein PF002_g9800 [Phytophthora fragariae]|uniref:Reverse transcriptase domain-containing protein n=1 Tax=Phytophthora fragariae TaxID=53985 RepID=A0A6A3ZRK5_9STRA|nr:hypothetical protein PF002_g9800 [Phytophthora fragariae]